MWAGNYLPGILIIINIILSVILSILYGVLNTKYKDSDELTGDKMKWVDLYLAYMTPIYFILLFRKPAACELVDNATIHRGSRVTTD